MMFATHAPGAPASHGGRPDALSLPPDAGIALLRRRGLHTGPVAYDRAERLMQLLVPEHSAQELPGLLDWLEWGGVPLELRGRSAYRPGRAAVWLRPPGPGYEIGRVDLVRLVSAAATECHRARLCRATGRRAACSAAGGGRTQPLAFS